VKSFKRSDYAVLVRLFLKEPTRINYPREYGLAKKLLSSYDDFTFWKSTLLDPKRKVLNSLAYFLTEEGKYFLKYNYHIHEKRGKLSAISPENPSTPLEENKTGESLNIKLKKKSSLIDFINDNDS
jgi:hypothetical protein